MSLEPPPSPRFPRASRWQDVLRKAPFFVLGVAFISLGLAIRAQRPSRAPQDEDSIARVFPSPSGPPAGAPAAPSDARGRLYETPGESPDAGLDTFLNLLADEASKPDAKPSADRFKEEFLRRPALRSKWEEIERDRKAKRPLSPAGVLAGFKKVPEFRRLVSKFQQDPGFRAMMERAAQVPGVRELLRQHQARAAAQHRSKRERPPPGRLLRVEAGGAAAPSGAADAPRAFGPDAGGPLSGGGTFYHEGRGRLSLEGPAVEATGENGETTPLASLPNVPDSRSASASFLRLCFGRAGITQAECQRIAGYLGPYGLWGACFAAGLYDRCRDLCAAEPRLHCSVATSFVEACVEVLKAVDACGERCRAEQRAGCPPSVATSTRPPTITAFTATPSAIVAGESAMLRWETADTQSATIHPDVDARTVRGSARVWPTETREYTLVAYGASGGIASRSVTITVRPGEPSAGDPEILSFTASPREVDSGQSVTLAWRTRNAEGVSIEPGLGEREPGGSVAVFPTTSTVYRLTATGEPGSRPASMNRMVVVRSYADVPAAYEFVIEPARIVFRLGGGVGSALQRLSSSARGNILVLARIAAETAYEQATPGPYSAASIALANEAAYQTAVRELRRLGQSDDAAERTVAEVDLWARRARADLDAARTPGGRR